MSLTARRVTVSIVSHGQWHLVKPLLDQLSMWCHGEVDKVILTLNRKEHVELDPALRVQVELITNDTPKGFGANHNAAFKRCASPWFLVLNPDIRIDRDVLSEMLVQADAGIGLLAPRILEPGRVAPEPYRDILTPLELWRRRRAGHLPPSRPAWVAGMFMLLRREAFQQIGGFDKRYFMYCEDVDLCARLQLAGWRLRVCDQLRVLHEAQRDSHSSPRALAWHLASLARLWTSAAFWRFLRLECRARLAG